MPCPFAGDMMHTIGIIGTYSPKSLNINPLCVSWTTVFRRISGLIQDKSVPGTGVFHPFQPDAPNRKDETMQYVLARDIAEKWGVSSSLIRRLCRQGRISGAVCKDGVWRIPEDAVRSMRTVFKYMHIIY